MGSGMVRGKDRVGGDEARGRLPAPFDELRAGRRRHSPRRAPVVDKDEGTRAVPGTWLEALAVAMRMTQLEWRVMAVVLVRQPITAWRLAGLLERKYSHVKRAVRELLRWHILTRSPEGLRFRFEPTAWSLSEDPAGSRSGTVRPPQYPASGPSKDRELEFDQYFRMACASASPGDTRLAQANSRQKTPDPSPRPASFAGGPPQVPLASRFPHPAPPKSGDLIPTSDPDEFILL